MAWIVRRPKCGRLGLIVVLAMITSNAALLPSCGGSGQERLTDSGVSTDSRPGAPDAAPAGMPDAGPVAAAAFCDELTRELCEAEQGCCTDSASRYASVDDCFAAQNPACLRDVQSLTTDSQTGYDPAVARAELDKLAARLASCDTTINPWFVSRDGLFRMFQGTVGGGGDCSPANADDRGPVMSCRYPDVCRLQAIPLRGTCGDPIPNGGACVTELECAEGLRCEPPQTFNGTCRARLGDGAGCTENGDCQSLICSAGSCVAATTNAVYCFNTP